MANPSFSRVYAFKSAYPLRFTPFDWNGYLTSRSARFGGTGGPTRTVAGQSRRTASGPISSAPSPTAPAPRPYTATSRGRTRTTCSPCRGTSFGGGVSTPGTTAGFRATTTTPTRWRPSAAYETRGRATSSTSTGTPARGMATSRRPATADTEAPIVAVARTRMSSTGPVTMPSTRGGGTKHTCRKRDDSASPTRLARSKVCGPRWAESGW